MIEIAEMVWTSLQQEVKELRNRVEVLIVRSERSETASGVPAYTLATAPLAANNAKGGDMVFISNGRKTGEGAGVGTGIVAYYNPNTNSYFRFADDTAVVV